METVPARTVRVEVRVLGEDLHHTVYSDQALQTICRAFAEQQDQLVARHFLNRRVLEGEWPGVGRARISIGPAA